MGRISALLTGKKDDTIHQLWYDEHKLMIDTVSERMLTIGPVVTRFQDLRLIVYYAVATKIVNLDD